MLKEPLPPARAVPTPRLSPSSPPSSSLLRPLPLRRYTPRACAKDPRVFGASTSDQVHAPHGLEGDAVMPCYHAKVVSKGVEGSGRGNLKHLEPTHCYLPVLVVGSFPCVVYSCHSYLRWWSPESLCWWQTFEMRWEAIDLLIVQIQTKSARLNSR